MRTILAGRCARRTTQRAPRTTESITAWARDVVARPAAHLATEREASIVADLLAQVEVAR